MKKETFSLERRQKMDQAVEGARRKLNKHHTTTLPVIERQAVARASVHC